MKRLFLILIFLKFGIANAQIPVTDAAANGTLTSQLTTATTSLVQLYKTYDLISDTAKKIEKVNSVVKSINNIYELIKMQEEAVKNIRMIVSKSKGSRRKNIIQQTSDILKVINQTINMVNQTLTSGFFNMNDKERTDIYDNSKRKILLQTAKTRVLLSQFK